MFCTSASITCQSTAVPIVHWAYQRINIKEDYLGVRQLRFCGEVSLVVILELAVGESNHRWKAVF